MRLPPDLTFVQLSATTSGTANTDVTTQVLAASGAFTRYRIWAVSLSGLPNNTGKLAIELRGALQVARLASVVGGDDYQAFPGGILCDINTVLNGVHRSDVISQVLRCQVYYTIEAS